MLLILSPPPAVGRNPCVAEPSMRRVAMYTCTELFCDIHLGFNRKENGSWKPKYDAELWKSFTVVKRFFTQQYNDE